MFDPDDLPEQPDPVEDLDSEALASIISDCLDGRERKTVTGLDAVKSFYNEVYSLAEARLRAILLSREMASWILEAYKQLELWTYVYRRDSLENPLVQGSRELAPVGRYGWRYVIDYCLQELDPDSRIFRGNVGPSELRYCFTLLMAMSFASEYSNNLHYFGSQLDRVALELDPPESIFMPILSKTQEDNYKSKIRYLMREPLWKEYPQLYPGPLQGPIADMLREGFSPVLGYTFEDCHVLIERFIKDICGYISIQVNSYPYMVDSLADLCGFPSSKVDSILTAMLFSQDKIRMERDFLKKSQAIRMLNFAGIKLPRLSHLDTIYDPDSIRSDIISAPSHFILSGGMAGEWVDVVGSRLIHGKTTYFSSFEKLQPLLSAIEEHYHKRIFEREILSRMEAAGMECVSNLKRIQMEGKMMELPCGEIDILGFCSRLNVLHVVEAKAFAGAIDFRGHSQCYNDHFGSKNYHGKFLKKLDWIEHNRAALAENFLRLAGTNIGDTFVLEPRFVSKDPSIAKFFVTQYPMLTFDEYFTELSSVWPQT
jgi:hypothetical protein